MAKVITLNVMGKRRPLSVQERILFARRGSVEVLWPVQVPEYGTDKAAAVRRKRNYWDAVNAADELTDRICTALAGGAVLHVNIWPGAILTRTETTFANVVAGELLSELCDVADEVTIGVDSEDPRQILWDSED